MDGAQERPLPQGIELRFAGRGDGAAVAQAASLGRGAALTEEYASAFASSAGNHLLVAWDGGRLAGYVLAYELPRLDADRMLCVYELEVAEPYRRRGIGRAMMQTMQRRAVERGCGKMWLFTPEGNAPARALYEELGGEADPGEVFYRWRPASQ